MARPRRAIGIIRVSQTKGREGESFASPKEQQDRIEAACKRDGLELLRVYEEMDVSGGRSLDERPGLGAAVQAIEAGKAEVVAAAYFDRLFRSLRTQGEVLARVEASGGVVFAVDVGKVSGESAGQWLSATMHGMIAEYYRRQVSERSKEAQRRAIARGVPPYSQITAGYRKLDDGRWEPDPQTAPAVVTAFEMRADGASTDQIRSYLASAGIMRGYNSIRRLLTSRIVLGEIHFGGFEPNLNAFPGIVDPELWSRAQRTVPQRGRPSPPDRLLARLAILRCASCGSTMALSVQRQKGRRYPYYRCGAHPGDCDDRSMISAEMVENIVVEHVRAAIADDEGRASAESAHKDAEIALEMAQMELDSAIRAFARLADEPAAVERLSELQEARDDARRALDQLGDVGSIVINGDADWDRLTFDERRSLIRATVARVSVARGRGPDRITVDLVGQKTASSAV